MDKKWKDIRYVTVRYTNGRIYHYPTLDEAVRKTPWEYLKGCRQDNRFYVTSRDWTRYDFIDNIVEFRCDLGMLIPREVIAEAMERPQSAYYTYNRGDRTRFKFRDGPVSGLSNRNYSPKSKWARYFSTARDRNFVNHFDEDAKEHHIYQRDYGAIDNWDYDRDKYCRDRNWKRYRRHQWRR